MAREQPRVWALLDEVWAKAVPALERERDLLLAARDAQGVRDPIEPLIYQDATYCFSVPHDSQAA